MRHAMMMALYGGTPGGLLFGMVRRTVMKLLIVVLALIVVVLWFRLRQERARRRGWRL